MKPMTHKTTYKVLVDFGTVCTFDIQLRELKNHWIDKHGTKYRKDDGKQVGAKYTPRRLDLTTVKEI